MPYCIQTILRHAILGLAALGLLPAAQAAPKTSLAATALYVANVGDGSILRCDGKTGRSLAVLGGGAMLPIGLALGPDKNLYVSSFSDSTANEGRILRFSPQTGKMLGTFIPQGRGGMGRPVCLTFGPDKNLYVSNWKNHDVRRFDGRTGAFLGVFARHNSGGLADPGDITFGPDGNLYVTNNSVNDVLRFDGRTGKPLGTFVKAKSGGLTNPQNIAFGPTGDLFVGGPAGVLEYSGKTGRFVKVFAAPHAGGLKDVGGLTFGPDDNLYVGDWQNNDVLRFDGRTGAFRGVFVNPKSGLSANRYILFGPRGGGGQPVASLLTRQARLRRQAASAQPAEPALLAPGTAAPDFAAQAPDGTLVHLSDFKGKPVVLDFWSTWCGPCQMSMPYLEKVYEQVKDQGVAVLGVCVWDQKPAYTTWLAEKKGAYSFPTAFDPAGRGPDSIAHKLYNVSGIPTQYIIDKDGNVAASLVGFEPNDHRLEAALGKLGVTVKDQAAEKLLPPGRQASSRL